MHYKGYIFFFSSRKITMEACILNDSKIIVDYFGGKTCTKLP